MTNKNETPEMPVEIFTPPVKNPDGYYLADEMNVPGDTSYTRTDTIPSKAEVAREFLTKTFDEYVDIGFQDEEIVINRLRLVFNHRLKEWEDAEK